MRQRWPPFLVLFVLYASWVTSPGDCLPRPAADNADAASINALRALSQLDDDANHLLLGRTLGTRTSSRAARADQQPVTEYAQTRQQPEPVTLLTTSDYSQVERDNYDEKRRREASVEEDLEEGEEDLEGEESEDYPSSLDFYRESRLHTSRQRQLLQETDGLGGGGGEEGKGAEELFDLQAEIEEFKRRLLAELGLERPPDTSKANVTESEMQRMLELYHRSVEESRQQEEEEEERERRNHWSGPGSFESVYRIYSYKNTGQELKSSWEDARADRFLFFQMAADFFSERDHRNRSLSSAKLHLFRPCGDMRPTSRKGADGRREVQSPVRLAIYQLTEPWMASNASQWGEPALPARILVEEKLLSGISGRQFERRDSGPAQDDWLVVDVSKPAAAWLETPLLNYGLLVKCFGGETRSSGSPPSGSKPSSPASRARKDSSSSSKAVTSVAHSQQWRESKSVLDILVRESNLPFVDSRFKRSASDSGGYASNGEQRHGSPLWNSNVLGDGGQRLECSATKKSKLCCRYSLNVSFQDIGWDWIKEPLQFEANFCRGRCPSKAKNYASTHALIQSIINSKQGKRAINVPRPCCAPRKLKSLNILHLDQSSPPKLVMTRKKGMIVKECACS